MSDYILSCCSTSDLSEKHYSDRNIHTVLFHFIVNGKEYMDDFGKSYPFEKFYSDMEKGAVTKTSQISAGEYYQYFEPFLKEGRDLLHVTLSSGLSGTFQSACNAASMLKEKYPERKIYIVDSLGASSGYGLLMDKLADLRDSGMNIDELRAWAEENKLRVHHWFFSTDLKYYVAGGRISKTSGFLGNLLHICPLLNMDEDGHLVPREKIRTIKKVEKAIVDKMEMYCDDGLDYSGKVYISMSNCMDYAKPVADMVQERFKKMNGKVEINSIGTTIGSHTGPGTVALFFFGKKRSN